jgi:hypothetical protein
VRSVDQPVHLERDTVGLWRIDVRAEESADVKRPASKDGRGSMPYPTPKTTEAPDRYGGRLKAGFAPNGSASGYQPGFT